MAAKSKRADGRYQVSVDLGRDATGKRQRKYFYGDTQREANAKKNAFLRAQEAGFVADDKLLVGEWLDKWESVYMTGGYSSQEMKKINLKKLRAAFGDERLASVTKSDVQLFANSVSGYSDSMVSKIKGLTNRVFSDAFADRLIPRLPTDGVKWAGSGSGTHRALEAWERDMIRRHWHAHPQVGIWAMLMLYAGLRRGEALALTWDDVDFGKEEIRVCRALRFENNKAVEATGTKTLAGVRDVPILEPLKDALLSLPREDGQRICKPINAPTMTRTAFTRGWESFLSAMTAILKGESGDEDKSFSIRPHDLRHSYCTMLYDAGVDLKAAQYLMGHADSQMTMQVYTHLSNAKKKSSIEALKRHVKKIK